MNRIRKRLAYEYKKSMVILSLAKRSFHQQYFGSALGFFWAFIEPLLYIGILYTVFTVGLKASPNSGIPFAVYLLTGMSAWLYFYKTLNASSSTVSQYSYLVNNVDFKTSYLPIINIAGNLIPHFLFVALSILVAWLHNYAPSVYTLQVFYYLFAMSTLLLGLSWLTSSTNLFVKDISKIVSLVTQFGFWLTPIFWNISMIPDEYQWIVKLNPAYYIVRGYRDSLVEKIPFWAHLTDTLYFWGFTAIILFAGITIFKRLEPHFGDVI
jgi:ABC-type polysaccharide/polyol phosphate export permease